MSKFTVWDHKSLGLLLWSCHGFNVLAHLHNNCVVSKESALQQCHVNHVSVKNKVILLVCFVFHY